MSDSIAPSNSPVPAGSSPTGSSPTGSSPTGSAPTGPSHDTPVPTGPVSSGWVPTASVSAGATAEPEVARLNARIATLEKELEQARSAPAGAVPTDRGARPGRWRAWVAGLLIVLGSLLAPLSVLAVWSSNVVSDTGQYVATVSPLAKDPDVQAAVTDAVTRQVFTYVDVGALTTQLVDALQARGVPPQVADRLKALETPITSGVQGFVHDKVAEIVASPAFAKAWDEANRAAHQQMVNVLSGKQGGAVSSKNGAVTINLGPFVSQVKDRLVAQGFTVASNIPAVNASFTVFQSKGVTKAQGLYSLLNTLGVWLPVIALVLLLIGIYVAGNHRRAVLASGLGVAGGMLLLGVALAVLRPLYLDAVPSTLPHDAAASIFDTVVRFLRSSLRAVLVAALVIAAAAFMTGGSVTAVSTRRGLVHGIGWLRGGAESAGLSTGAFGAWVWAHKRALRIGVVAAGAVALVFWTQPTVGVVVLLAVLVLLLLAVVEFLGRPPATSGGPGSTGGPGASGGAGTPGGTGGPGATAPPAIPA